MPLLINDLASKVIVCVVTPSLDDIIKAIETAIRLIGKEVPAWLRPLAGYLVLAAVALVVIFGFLYILDKIVELWKTKFWPIFYSHEKKQRAFYRRKFAEHIESELRRLDAMEEWKDYRFAELEAEVNAEGRRRLFGFVPYLGSRTTLRQEPSLSKALKNSKERLILVEGDPGSGKSVALRHAAQELARSAMRSRGLKSIIPIYLNLKELERSDGPVDRNFIQSFVLKTLNRVNDRDIEKFLEDEFEKGIRDGTWVFFFDSFDEIPEVLSSIEADTAIQQYADAIAAFLGGFNSCRGVTASRYFRGPKQFEWPRFKILPLSQRRRLELIQKAGLKSEQQKKLRSQLLEVDPDIQAMASNPMFLSLLCAHVRDGNPFPENGYSLFESYITSRFKRDAERLVKHYQLDALVVRATAETMAFCMTADFRLGLSPTRQQLKESIARLGFVVNDLDTHLDALEYIKLARSETTLGASEKHQFTFAHRRFQEYFATSVVLRNSERVSPSDLLADARWRETAVVLCQTQELEVLKPLINEAQARIEAFDKAVDRASHEDVWGKVKLQIPPTCFHVLGLLQEGFSRRMNLLPESFRTAASDLLSFVSRKGSLRNRKAALEVAGVMSHDALNSLLRREFLSESFWLREVAFRQVARLTRIPDDISRDIRQTLILLLGLGRLHKERGFIQAHLARLDKAAHFLSVLKLLIWLRRVDFLLLCLPLLLLLFQAYQNASTIFGNDVHIFKLFVASSVLLLFVFSSSSISSLLLSMSTDARVIAWYFLSLRTLFAAALYIWLKLQGVIPASRGEVAVLLGFWVIWTPSALHAATSLRIRIRPVLWPFLPILSIALIIRFAKEIWEFTVDSFNESRVQPKKKPAKENVTVRVSLKSFGNSLKERSGEIVGGIVVAVVAPAIAFSVVRYPKVVFPIMGIFPFAAISLFLAPIGVDWWRLRKYQKERRHVSGAELIKAIASYRTDPLRTRFLKYVRVENLVVPDQDTMDRIESLGWELERLHWVPFNWADLQGRDVLELTVREKYFNIVTRAWRRNADLVDEVYRLLEQLHYRAKENISV